MYISDLTTKKEVILMNHYKRLTLEDRYQIKALKESGLSYRKIANQLGRFVSTISREINKNINANGHYSARQAFKKVQSRRKNVGPKLKIKEELSAVIESQLKLQWSPEQISGRLKREERYDVSHETIYQFIFKDYKNGGDLYTNLRRKRKTRRSRQTTRNLKNLGIRNHPDRWIEDRPPIVDQRIRIGDFERDTVLGKHNGPVLFSIVDRTSVFTKLSKIAKINAMLTHRATVQLLKDQIVHTITNDNGPEFGSSWMTEDLLKIKIYFNTPYSSWQRGTNENTNGLIRQYFPKGTDFNAVSDEEIQEVENLLNNRPRKNLGYKTPFEVHKMKSGVALST